MLIVLLVGGLVGLLVCWLVDRLLHSLERVRKWLVVGWSVTWLLVSLVGWMVNWLVDLLFSSSDGLLVGWSVAY